MSVHHFQEFPSRTFLTLLATTNYTSQYSVLTDWLVTYHHPERDTALAADNSNNTSRPRLS